MNKLVSWLCAAVFTLGSAGSFAADGKADRVLVTEAFHSLLYLPVYVAKHQGIFAQNQIDVATIRSAGSGPTALAAVLSGEAQFSVHGPEHVGFAQQKGGTAKAVSAVANSAPVWILAKPDFTFNSPADLKGKRLVSGLAPGTSNTLLLRLLQQHGLDPKKDVTINEVQNGSELGPLLAGRADVAVVYEPQADQGVGQGLKVIYDFTRDYPEYAFSTINTSEKIITDNPQLVARFVKSINESLAFIRQHPDEAKKVARLEFSSLDAKVVDAAVQRMIDSNVYPADAVISPLAFTTAIDIQKFVGNITQDMPYEQIVDGQFASKP
ncbi:MULTISPECIES: ABC transporter substrate-binding protein [unclassified Brenneria]|uniref:ABC transporter substrate-binding protein n=1 Tax=unclassified Brenneria TaxID=2634434 RepID=UPI0018F0DA26|nr:ABC transporter substrate-binding protein [Brenneria sp. L3-3C-1]MBJ7221763.1 ABC transporter substrate-binding protein [Brenneria sp. L3-3C-1]MEE3643004.1 ABC transporter substrate-binding protein [Brenneria sp. L3_3C_1]